MYLERFLDIDPRIALDKIHTRFKKTQNMEEEMKDYVKERIQAEDAYARHLQRMNKRAELEKDKEKDAALGEVRKVMLQVIGNAGDTSLCHTLLCDRLRTDFESAITAKIKTESPHSAEIKAKEAVLVKLAREGFEKHQKLLKRQKEAEKGKSNEQKLSNAEKAYEEYMEKWKTDAVPLFSEYEAFYNVQLEFLKSSMRKVVEIQLDNLRLLTMNLEKTLKNIENLNVIEDIKSFAEHFSKEDDTIANDTTVERKNSDISAITTVSSGKSSSAESEKKVEDKKSAEKVDEDFEVDEEGFRIPQMDSTAWKNRIVTNPDFGDDEDGDMEDTRSRTMKFKIDIKKQDENKKEPDDISSLSAIKETMDISKTVTLSRKQKQQTISSSPSRNSKFSEITPVDEEDEEDKEMAASPVWDTFETAIPASPEPKPLSGVDDIFGTNTAPSGGNDVGSVFDTALSPFDTTSPWSTTTDGSDPFSQQTTDDPFSKVSADTTTISQTDPFGISSASDPFGTISAKEPLPTDKSTTNDPFIPSTFAASDPFRVGPTAANDPFGASPTSASEPFGASSSTANDPFGAPSSTANDPFGAPSSTANDPFGAPPTPANDPFGAPPTPASDRFSTSATTENDPFSIKTPNEPVQKTNGVNDNPFGAPNNNMPAQKQTSEESKLTQQSATISNNTAIDEIKSKAAENPFTSDSSPVPAKVSPQENPFAVDNTRKSVGSPVFDVFSAYASPSPTVEHNQISLNNFNAPVPPGADFQIKLETKEEGSPGKNESISDKSSTGIKGYTESNTSIFDDSASVVYNIEKSFDVLENPAVGKLKEKTLKPSSEEVLNELKKSEQDKSINEKCDPFSSISDDPFGFKAVIIEKLQSSGLSGPQSKIDQNSAKETKKNDISTDESVESPSELRPAKGRARKNTNRDVEIAAIDEILASVDVVLKSRPVSAAETDKTRQRYSEISSKPEPAIIQEEPKPRDRKSAPPGELSGKRTSRTLKKPPPPPVSPTSKLNGSNSNSTTKPPPPSSKPPAPPRRPSLTGPTPLKSKTETSASASTTSIGQTDKIASISHEKLPITSDDVAKPVQISSSPKSRSLNSSYTKVNFKSEDKSAAILAEAKERLVSVSNGPGGALKHGKVAAVVANDIMSDLKQKLSASRERIEKAEAAAAAAAASTPQNKSPTASYESLSRKQVSTASRPVVSNSNRENAQKFPKLPLKNDTQNQAPLSLDSGVAVSAGPDGEKTFADINFLKHDLNEALKSSKFAVQVNETLKVSLTGDSSISGVITATVETPMQINVPEFLVKVKNEASEMSVVTSKLNTDKKYVLWKYKKIETGTVWPLQFNATINNSQQDLHELVINCKIINDKVNISELKVSVKLQGYDDIKDVNVEDGEWNKDSNTVNWINKDVSNAKSNLKASWKSLANTSEKPVITVGYVAMDNGSEEFAADVISGKSITIPCQNIRKIVKVQQTLYVFSD